MDTRRVRDHVKREDLFMDNAGAKILTSALRLKLDAERT